MGTAPARLAHRQPVSRLPSSATRPTDGTHRTHPGRMAIPPARLAHQRPVRRLPSSAQVPSTAPTVLTPDGWPYPRRETRTPSASLSTAFQRTSPTDGTHRPYPGRMGTAPAYPTLPSQSPDRLERCKSTDHRTHPARWHRTRTISPRLCTFALDREDSGSMPPHADRVPRRDRQAPHRSSTRGFGSTRAAQGAAVPLSTDTSTRLSRSSGSQTAQSPTVSHPRPMAPYADHRHQRLGTFALDRRDSSPMPPFADHLHPTDSHSTRVSYESRADGIARGGTSIDSA